MHHLNRTLDDHRPELGFAHETGFDRFDDEEELELGEMEKELELAFHLSNEYDLEGPVEEAELDLFFGKVLRRAARVVKRGVRGVAKAAFRAVPALALARAAVSVGSAALRGKNLVRAVKEAARVGIRGLREQLRFVQMVAPFVPGVGSGVAAALAAASALASGRPITYAALEAARGAIPGGPLARSAFDVGLRMARGGSVSQAFLETVRRRLPGGPAARAAFDASVAIGRGQRIQRVVRRTVRRALPPSPYATNVVAFARRAGSRRWNIQDAALTQRGRSALRRMRVPAFRRRFAARAFHR